MYGDRNLSDPVVLFQGKNLCMSNYRVSRTILVLIVYMALPPSVYAEKDEGFVSFRTGLGMIFLGGSALMVKQGIDFRNEADDLYLRYQTAEIAEEADRLYSRTNNRDVKSQVSLAIAGAFAVSGFRFLFFGEDDNDKANIESRRFFYDTMGNNVFLDARATIGGFGVFLGRKFF